MGRTREVGGYLRQIDIMTTHRLLPWATIGFGINLGIWMSKFLMVAPVFSPDARPLDNLLDVALSIGLLAGFVAVVAVLAKRYPMYSQWEINLAPIKR